MQSEVTLSRFKKKKGHQMAMVCTIASFFFVCFSALTFILVNLAVHAIYFAAVPIQWRFTNLSLS